MEIAIFSFWFWCWNLKRKNHDSVKIEYYPNEIMLNSLTLTVGWWKQCVMAFFLFILSWNITGFDGKWQIFLKKEYGSLFLFQIHNRKRKEISRKLRKNRHATFRWNSKVMKFPSFFDRVFWPGRCS